MNLMTGEAQAISDFWRAFTAHESELAAAPSANAPVCDLLLNRLHRIHPALFFEFSSGPGGELIITADGDSSLFPLVDAVVAIAPKVAGWRILALRPKRGFPATTSWNGVTVALADVFFEPLERQGSDDLGVRMFVRGLASEFVEDAHNALLRALDHALGERQFAEAVHHSEVLPLAADGAAVNRMPITELEAHIRWRTEKLEKQHGQKSASLSGGSSTL